MVTLVNPDVEKFVQEFTRAFEDDIFVKMLLNKPTVNVDDESQKIVVRPVEIKGIKKISFVSTYPTKEIVKNYSLEESRSFLNESLGARFANAVLFTTQRDMRLSYNRRRRSNIRFGKATYPAVVAPKHDHEKQRLIGIEDNRYLKELGVMSENGAVAPSMRSKYRQINKYIETIDATLKNSQLKESEKITVADMGSGKGYLTFALYDFLTHTLKKDARVTGVEVRKDMVELCDGIARKCDFQGLSFHKGDIASYMPTEKIDMLIALHACDTATDDAIYKGITNDASVIIVAPCCHRQIRKEMNVTNELKSVVDHGILMERQSEMVTDTLRGLMLEAHGYKTKIFEFITDEHTHKNVMIVAIKNGKENAECSEKMTALKKVFGIRNFYLEDLFEADSQ